MLAAMARVRGVLFDLDNTLVDRAASLTRYADVFRRDLEPGLPADLVASRLVEADGGGYRDRKTVLEEIRAWPEWPTRPTTAEIDRHWMWEFPPLAAPMEGLHETLADLFGRGFRIGIVTNGSARGQNAKIMALHVWRHVSAVVVSESVGMRKPDPRIFALALDELGVRAADAWFVGDHPEYDVVGAQAAGLTGVWMKGAHAWPAGVPAPTVSIRSLTELPAIVETA